MKKIISLLIMVSIFSCSPKMSYVDGHEILKYGTKDFEEFEKNATIKKEKAWEIYYERQRISQVHVMQWLFFVIDKDYVFSGAVDPKTRKVELSGLRINSETGEVKLQNSEIMIKYENAFTLEGKGSYFFPIKAKYKKKE